MSLSNEPGFLCRLTHGPSGSWVVTEPPLDNGGTGGHFSPTDLFSASLAACVLTTLALTAKRENIPFGPARAQIEKRMTPPPRRVGEVSVEIQMPAGLSPAQREKLEEAGRGCPVVRSISPDVSMPMRFVYPD